MSVIKTKEQWNKVLNGAALDDFDLWCGEFVSSKSKRHEQPEPLCTNKEYCEQYLKIDPKKHYDELRKNVIYGIKKGYVMGTCVIHKYYPLRVDENDQIIRKCIKCEETIINKDKEEKDVMLGYNFIGMVLPRCRECGCDLGFANTIPYCYYKCNLKLVNKIGVQQAGRRLY